MMCTRFILLFPVPPSREVPGIGHCSVTVQCLMFDVLGSDVMQRSGLAVTCVCVTGNVHTWTKGRFRGIPVLSVPVEILCLHLDERTF